MARSGLIEGSAASPRRRRRSAEERPLIVEEALAAGASVARVARKYGVNTNQVFAWKRLYEDGRLGAPASGMRLLPVRVVEEYAIPKEPPSDLVPPAEHFAEGYRLNEQACAIEENREERNGLNVHVHFIQCGPR